MSQFSFTSPATAKRPHGLPISGKVLSPSYAIRDKKGRHVLQFDSFLMHNTESQATITSAPIETGKYHSLHKVLTPPEISIVATISVQRSSTNSNNPSNNTERDILLLLESMIASTELYAIETPQKLFKDYDLIYFNHGTSAKQGVSLMSIQMRFQHVLQKQTVQRLSLTGSSPLNHIKTQQVQAAIKESVLNHLKSAGANLEKALNKAIDKVENKALTAINTLENDVTNTIDTIEKKGEKVINTIQDDIISTMDRVQKHIEGAIQTVEKDVDSVVDQLQKDAENVINTIKSDIDKVEHDIEQDILSVIDDLEKDLLSHIDTIEQSLKTELQPLEKEFVTALDTITKGADGVIDTSAAALQRGIDKILRLLT